MNLELARVNAARHKKTTTPPDLELRVAREDPPPANRARPALAPRCNFGSGRAQRRGTLAISLVPWTSIGNHSEEV